MWPQRLRVTRCDCEGWNWVHPKASQLSTAELIGSLLSPGRLPYKLFESSVPRDEREQHARLGPWGPPPKDALNQGPDKVGSGINQ